MRVAMDVDGVVTDFVGAWLTAASTYDGVAYEPSCVTDFGFASVGCSDAARRAAWAALSEPGACLALDPLPGALDGVRAVMGLYDVVFVTSPLQSSRTWTNEREEWLRSWLGVPRTRVVHTNAKHLVAADVLVDDSYDNVRQFEAFGRATRVLRPLGVLWLASYNCAAPWNPRAESWAQLHEALLRRACGNAVCTADVRGSCD